MFINAFSLTFFGEWGDRSQITTIAIAADNEPFGVFFGGVFGHAFCTGLAVMGGKLLSDKISERTITFVGGILFLFFSFYSYMHPN